MEAESDDGKKQGLKEQMDKLEEKAYRQMGECQKGDITYCQKNEHC